MEAESIPLRRDWMFEKDLLEQTGDGYYRFDGNTMTQGSPKGHMVFQFKITNGGMYELLLRSNKNHPNPWLGNDCYVAVSSVQHKIFAAGPRYMWNWDTNIEVEPGKSIKSCFFCEVGLHTIELYGRSKNF
jgi:hypothetical protein